MNKKVFLVSSLSCLFALTGCGGGNSASSSSSSQAAPTTFAEQLSNAGISFSYEDPNPGFTKTEGANPDADITTGGSNNVLYEAASITSFDELLYRASLSYKEYKWSKQSKEEEGHTYAATLNEAAALDNSKYVSDLFPNDGAKYEIVLSKNAIGTKTFATASSDGTPNMAIFGAGFAKETVGDKTVYYVNATYLTAGITTTNLLNSGKGEVLYYEYNYSSFDKMGAGKRNYGCRVDFEVDFANTKLMNKDYTYTAITEKGSAPEYTSYAALVTRLVLTNLKSLG